MIYNEAFDYQWAMLAGGVNGDAVSRVADYQRKRLRRALLARALKPYFLEASFSQVMSTIVVPPTVASTLSTTKNLLVLDGAIRTTDFNGEGPSNNGFKLRLLRSGGDARVQILQDFIYDECLLAPWQCATRAADAGLMGQGAPWPLTWPVPMRLTPNEVIQVKAQLISPLVGVTPETTFCQFRAVMIDNQKEDDALMQELKRTIAANPLQRPAYLTMTTDDSARSIKLPAVGAFGQVEAKTKEASEHLLITGYAALFARTAAADEIGTTCNPKWRLQSSEGHTFSRELIDVQTYAYTRPDSFWQAFPVPFLLPKGSSMSALIDVPGFVGAQANAVLNTTEQLDNYVIFRCVTV